MSTQNRYESNACFVIRFFMAKYISKANTAIRQYFNKVRSY